MVTGKDITRAYWPLEHGANASADREAGDKLVDTMTLNELVEFFTDYTAGPTYCLVKDRTMDLLAKLPPRLNIKAARTEATAALEILRRALHRLTTEQSEA